MRRAGDALLETSVTVGHSKGSSDRNRNLGASQPISNRLLMSIRGNHIVISVLLPKKVSLNPALDFFRLISKTQSLTCTRLYERESKKCVEVGTGVWSGLPGLVAGHDETTPIWPKVLSRVWSLWLSGETAGVSHTPARTTVRAPRPPTRHATPSPASLF